MPFNLNMPKGLKPFYQKELAAYQESLAKDNLLPAWRHLERAHILGQPYPMEHTAVHFQMLLFGIKTKNVVEIIGQLPRLLVGGIKSWVGLIPVGNTGSANVPAWKPMPIPNDLKAIIQPAAYHLK